MAEPELPALPGAIRHARRALVLGFALLYGTLSLLRYQTFHSRSLDMAYYVRLVWGMAHGYSDNPVVGAPHWLGLHLEPILFVLGAPSRLGAPVAETLLIAQAVVAALALYPLHSLARRRIAPVCGQWSALAAALSIYLIPTVSRCLDYDFHPTTLLIAPLAAWIDAVDRGDRRAAWIWMGVSLSFREDVGLQVACASVAVALGGERRAAMKATLGAQALVGIAWFFGYALLIQPRFLPDPASGSFGAHFERFGGGAGGVGGVLGAALGNPVELLRYLASGDRLWYGPSLLATLGLVSIAAPRWLWGALPVFGINLLSDFKGVRGVQSHYATAMAPFLCASAIEGAARIAGWVERSSLSARVKEGARWAPVGMLCGTALVAWWLRGAAPGAADFSLAAYRDDEFARVARERVRELTGQARVVAEVRLLAHLAERVEPLMDPGQRVYWKK